MNKFKILSLIGGLLLVLSGCKDEDLAPILTFEQTQQGGYPRLLQQTNKLINLFDISGSVYQYTVEFVDLEKGNLVTEYRLELTYDDNNPENGDKSLGPIVYKTFGPSDFTDSENGHKSVTVTIPATEAIAAAKSTPAEIKAGDNFFFKGFVTLKDGGVYGAANSSSSVRGAAFRGHFDFTMPAACPSNLAGTYQYVTTESWCGGTASGSVTIQALGGGKYQFNDWSFGSYGVCYGGGVAAGDLNFTDVCNVVKFTGFTDSYGDRWSYVSEINGNEWTIQWENTYGESATAIIKYPNGGNWPITLQ
jgi:hypothetical protein